MTPFCIQIPNKAINPIPAEILNTVPVTCKAQNTSNDGEGYVQ